MMKAALGYVFLIMASGAQAAPAPPPPAKQALLSGIDLSRPFGAPAGWRFTASQGPEIDDAFGDPTGKAPGAILLCISPDGGRTCRPNLAGLLTLGGKSDMFSQPHFLNDARIVYPRPDLPLLLVQVASLHSGDGDQRVATTALSYNHVSHAFIPVYEKQTGRNNNQEIRYMDTGPLRGAIISAEPTENAPFGFWITVNRIEPGNSYRQVLRYRSATLYGDGNSLAVIDSDMPNLLQRLGLWRMGARLPLPAGPCPRPHLIKQELWCSIPPSTRQQQRP
jgi:hypothetical protein